MATKKPIKTTKQLFTFRQLLVSSLIWQVGWIILIGWFEVGAYLGATPVWLALFFGGVLFASAIVKLLSDIKLRAVKVLIWLVLCLGMAGLAYVMGLTLGGIHYLIRYT